MLFILLWEEFPEFKIHDKHEAAYLGEESFLSHVCKQTDNKFEVRNKSRQNINYIGDELVCRRVN